MNGSERSHRRRLSCSAALLLVCALLVGWHPPSSRADTAAPAATRTLVVAASPTVVEPIRALGEAFEVVQPGTSVQIVVLPGLDLRRTIAAVENHPALDLGLPRGPMHLVAPGGDELLTRLAHRGYIFPNSKRAYATVPLALVVPESLAEAPESFEALRQAPTLRIAVADPQLTTIGQRAHVLLAGLGGVEAFRSRMDISPDVDGVLDHLLSGQADVAIISGPQAYRQRERVRVVAVGSDAGRPSTVHSLAMLRSCPDRPLAEAFVRFTQGADARRIVTGLGYGLPPQ